MVGIIFIATLISTTAAIDICAPDTDDVSAITAALVDSPNYGIGEHGVGLNCSRKFPPQNVSYVVSIGKPYHTYSLCYRWHQNR